MLQQYWHWTESIQLPTVLLLGLMIVVGRLFATLFERLRLPGIVGLLCAGLVLGSSGFNLINSQDIQALSFLSNFALAFVALSLGLEFRAQTVRSLGAGISVLIVLECLLTFVLITLGSWLVTASLPFGLAAGAVGAASAPTAPLAIASQYKARGPLTNAIFAITGFDDAISIAIFSFASTFAVSLYTHKGDNLWQPLLLEPLLEIGLALLIGLLLGLLYCLLTRRINDGGLLLLWAVGAMFLAEGISHLLDYSLVLCNMILGAVIVNRISSAQQAKLRRSLETLMPLVFVLFFVFAGAQLDLRLLPTVGWAGLVYIACRTLGKWSGATAGAGIARLSPTVRKYAWGGLLSQVGVGLGLAMLLIEKFRPLGVEATGIAQQVLIIVTATSIYFEVIAPILTKWALVRAGEIDLAAPKDTQDAQEDAQEDGEP